jgi:hypothetical protein
MSTQNTTSSPATAAKRARKREPTQTPPEWFDLFRQHDDELVRIRLLWRRGGGRYRPIVPINLALEDLENAAFEDWEEFELRESHYDWATVQGESFVARDKRIEDAARELWAVAVAWTRAKGPVCDFQLRGYGSQGEILFEDGKRCNLSGERTRYDDDPTERSGVDENVRRLMSDERSSWRHLDQVKDGLISKLADERGRLFENVERASSAAPAIISNVHHLLDRAIAFHQRSVDDYVSRAGGERELEARAFAELQKSRRMDAVVGFFKDAAQSGANAILPFFQIMREQGGVNFSMPDFKVAQQAIAYLALTVDEDQLLACMSDRDDRKTLDHTLTVLDRLSRHPNELQALVEFEPFLRSLFSRAPFRAVATPEQKIAVNFIIGRVALYRVVQDDHG